MANFKTLPNLQALSISPSPAQTLPSEAVLDALKMMLIGASLNEVLTSITRLIEAHSEGMLCSIFLLDEDGLHLRYGVTANLPQAYRAATDGTCIGPNVGSCGAAAYLRQPVFISDILSHPNWANFRSVVLQSGLRAAWSTPIMSQDGKVLGTFCMYYREVRHPGTNDIQLIDYASRIAGIAIERERSRSALTKSEAELRTIIDAIPQLIIAVGADGTFLYANQAVRDYTGLTKGLLWRWPISFVAQDSPSLSAVASGSTDNTATGYATATLLSVAPAIRSASSRPLFARAAHSLAVAMPLCGGTMHVVERLSAAQLLLQSPPHLIRCAA